MLLWVKQMRVDYIDGQPGVEVALGEHVFLTAGDKFLKAKSS